MTQCLLTSHIVRQFLQEPFCERLEPSVDFALGAFETEALAEVFKGGVVALLKPGLLAVLSSVFGKVLSQEVGSVAHPSFIEPRLVFEYLGQWRAKRKEESSSAMAVYDGRVRLLGSAGWRRRAHARWERRLPDKNRSAGG